MPRTVKKTAPLAINKIRGDLNVVLNKAQIDHVLREVLGPKGEKLPDIALASDHCCVDASVGSSVAGPFSSVASSVSIPAPERLSLVTRDVAIGKSKLTQKIKEENLHVDVQMPGNLIIR